MKYPTISLRHDRRKVARNGGDGTVEVLVSYQGKKLYVPTGVRVPHSSWKGERVVAHQRAATYNKQITDTLTRINAAVSRLWSAGRFSLDALKQELQQCAENVASPIEWIEQRISTHNVRPETRKAHHTIIGNLNHFGGFRTWADFTQSNIIAYDNWLHSLKFDGHPLSQGTIRNYHKRLKVFLNIARREGIISSDPYDGVRIERPKTPKRKYLTDEQRDEFEAMELDGALAHARDLFMFQCYTGLGYSDMADFDAATDLVTEEGETFITGTRRKTSTTYRIMLLDKARAILERYNYKLPMMTNQKYNFLLKIAAAKIRPDVTSHMGRHTFATWALRNNVPIEVISAMLAHSNINITQIYAEQQQEHVNEEYRRLNKL